MGNLISIADIRKDIQNKVSLEDWKEFAESLYSTIERYEKELNAYKAKNHQLENLLLAKYDGGVITPEEQICIEQIDRLKYDSTNRQLTLEEVKRLDLLVKNLKLIRDGNTITVESKKVDTLQEADLVAIATNRNQEAE